MAGVGIAQIGRHRHDGGIAVGQASSGFLHSFSLKQAIDAVVEQNAEASLNFENAQTGLSGQLRDARRLRQISQQQILRPQQFLGSIGVKWQERQLASSRCSSSTRLSMTRLCPCNHSVDGFCS